MQDLKYMIHKLGLQANRSWIGRMVKKDFKTWYINRYAWYINWYATGIFRYAFVCIWDISVFIYLPRLCVRKNELNVNQRRKVFVCINHSNAHISIALKRGCVRYQKWTQFWSIFRVFSVLCSKRRPAGGGCGGP